MFTLRLLGGIVVQGPSGPLSGRAARRHPLALLALLAGAAEKGASREKLATYLWPESSEERARRNLSDSVYLLRKALRDDILLAVGDVLRLNPDAIRVDVWTFQAALERGALDEAVALYDGDFLDGFHLGDSREFEEWVAGERTRLADLYGGALVSLAEQAEQNHEHRTAAERWKQLAAHDRYNSRAVLRLMQALSAAGDPANALNIGQVHERLLREELDLDPPPEFLDCIEGLRYQSSAGAAVPRPSAEAESGAFPPPALLAASDSRAASTAELAVADVATARRWRNFTIGATVAVVIAFGIYWAATREGAGSMRTAEPSALNRVAVFPFSYQGSEENAEFGDGMAYLLSAALDGAGELTAVDPNAVIPAVRRDADGAADAESARRIATGFGAGRFVLGHVTEAGASLRLSAWLYERDSLVVQAVVDGPPDEFPALVDRLAAQLAVGVLGGESPLPEVAAKTTGSFEALKAYLQGESKFRSAGRPGAAREAQEAFGRAVQLDSTFALAWYRLAVTSGWTRRQNLSLNAADQAVRYAGRLGFRERGILNGWRAQWRGAYEESERHYAAVLARYPDDVEAWYGLGALRYHFAHLHGQPFTSAREPLERADALSLGDIRALAMLMYEAGLSGDLERFDSLLQVLAPSGSIPSFGLARALWRGSRQEQEAAREAVLAAAARTRDSDLQDVIGFVGRLGELDVARQLAGRLARRESPDMQAWGRLSLAFVALAEGQWSAAQAELDSLATLQPAWSLEYRAFMATAPFLSATRVDLEVLRDRLTRWDADAVLPNPHPSFYINAYNGVHPHLRLYLLGVVSARLGDYTAANAFAAELEGLAAPNAGSLSTDLAQSIRAWVAWSRGAYVEVLDEFEQAPIAIPYLLTRGSPFFNRAAERYLRARALQKVGRLREAAIVYETHGQYWADLVFRAPSELGLAEVSEALGDTVEARRHYDQFLRLWWDCDPDLRPFVEAAERRLAELSVDR
ncbi:MAG: BTAD domain-containing putative transcriptional regulator [Gemmatimonadales bacterium]|jgi:DNA-binding SARP family transcriptional activator/tetratricopeptide (TPR) repeat protein